jgi:hypothetical protein
MNASSLQEIEAELVRHLEAALLFLRARGSVPVSEAGPPDTVPAHARPPEGTDLTQAAKALYRARRQRERYFGQLAVAFAEPAWDIMLDLFIARREGRRVSVSSATIAADVPPTTALRWIAYLEENRILSREPDPTDRRRFWLCLEEAAHEQMVRYLSDCVVTGAACLVSAHCLSTVASA